MYYKDNGFGKYNIGVYGNLKNLVFYINLSIFITCRISRV